MSHQTESDKPLTKAELTNIIFDTTYAMDPNNTEYYDYLKLKYIALFEGEEEYAYDDKVGPKNPYKYAKDIFAAGRTPVGKITVGAGFNMDRPEARAEWEKIFGDELDFDKVYRGKKIEPDQILRLLKYSVDPREKELARRYGDVWTCLRPNEKIAILSAYYNGPGLVSEKTKFFANLKKYTNTDDPKYLQEAVIELGERSGKNPELISRRKLEARLLDSTKSPFYIEPNSNITMNFPIKVIPGKTRIPRDIEQYVPIVKDSEFVIWRTKLDNKVRVEHMRMEGKIYHRDEAQRIKDNSFGCRCYLDDVPNNLLIMDDNGNMVCVYSWIKYGGASSIVLE